MTLTTLGGLDLTSTGPRPRRQSAVGAGRTHTSNTVDRLRRGRTGYWSNTHTCTSLTVAPRWAAYIRPIGVLPHGDPIELPLPRFTHPEGLATRERWRFGSRSAIHMHGVIPHVGFPPPIPVERSRRFGGGWPSNSAPPPEASKPPPPLHIGRPPPEGGGCELFSLFWSVLSCFSPLERVIISDYEGGL